MRLSTYDAGPPQTSILLRPEPRGERLHWAVAHELGEELAGEIFKELGVDPRAAQPGTREQVANLLASRILLPTVWFQAAAASDCSYDLLSLKERFTTASHELIARRLLDLPPSRVITIFDQGRVTFRRGNVPGRIPRLTPAEQRCWQRVHDTGSAAEDATGVQHWPIHEPSWKREIVSWEISEFGQEAADNVDFA